MKITIIGAGIGGLTTAIALKQKGFEVEIFEAAPEFKKAGSGINLGINAMQVYQKLGLYEELFDSGSYTNSINLRTNHLKTLSAVDLTPFEEKYNAKSIAIHRSDLHHLLLKKLPDVKIHLNKKLRTLSESNNEIVLNFEDGTTHKAEIIIGADGINSKVRNSILGEMDLRIAKQICWRGITKVKLPQKYHTELNELWGKGNRFGFVHIDDKDHVYWFALANYKKDYAQEYKDVDLLKYYAEYDPIVQDIIKSTPKENILTNEMADLKPINIWHKGKVCLLGDAAHATTPNLGQGACQAIESALVLANCLEKYKTPEKAFENYQALRYKKANNVIDTSWKIGKLAHIENALGIMLRNSILKMTPKSVAIKQNDKIFEINK